MIYPKKFGVGLLILSIFSSLSLVYALPSGGGYPPKFTLSQGEWYDSWGFNRNSADGRTGFLPNVAYESLGTDKELAYSIGVWFKTTHPQKIERAEAILSYVQRWTDYGYDEDTVRMGGRPQEEWAWNADEMAHMFNETTLSVAMGDCEDMAFLCSTLYLAAGFEVVLVSPTGHVALMIWLPEYDNANYYWDILDGRGVGWIWVESTGEHNPLGWTPPDFTDGRFDVYLLSSMISNVNYAPHDPQAEEDVTVTVSVATQSSSISQVLLYYSINGGADRTLAMTPDGSLYKGTIPRQTEGAVVQFYVSVTDTEGNVSESGEFSYTVGGAWEIPGSPMESIIIGLAIGLGTLYFLARKRFAPSLPGPSTHLARVIRPPGDG
ncbi:MAG: hypothetical protein V1915_02110 [Candidatus Bathyarchaeota archaeon]